MLTLEQARAIAVDLSPSKRDERTGLPRVAGASPAAWILSFEPTSRTQSGAVAASAPSTLTFPNLLARDRPTLMTEWALTAINLVLISKSVAKEAAKAPFVNQAIVELLIGGDVVWTASQELGGELTAGKAGSNEFRFGADFINPIVLPPGRTMQLRTINIFTKVEIEELTNEFQAGSTISYNVHQLSGHRTL